MSGRVLSVLEKAEELAVRARTHSEGAQERDERARIATALADVGRQLTALTGAVDAYVAARDAGVSLIALDPPSDLIKPASGALPSTQALVAARRRVETLVTRAAEAVREAWPTWARAELEAVNPGRISRLNVARRARALELQKRLRAAASAKQPTARQIGEFSQDLRDLARFLADISEDDPVVLILDRIRRARMTLADLTDEEVNVLRADASVAGQIGLQTT